MFKILSVTSGIVISAAFCSQAQVFITHQSCDNSVCLTVPGVTPPPVGGSVAAAQDFNSNNGGGTVTNINDPFEGPWTYNNGSGTWSTAGQGPELGRAPSTRLTFPSITVTQAGNVRISFNHRYSFEDGAWDGGQLQVSVNGGTFVTVPGVAFVQNGYNGIVLANSVAEIRGQGGFVNTSAGYGTPAFITSIADIGCMSAGETLSIRFLAAFDTNTRQGDPAWQIDSFSVIEGAANGAVAEFFVSALPAIPGDTLSFQWQKSVTGNFGNFADISGGNDGFLVFEPTLTDNGACYRVIVTNSFGSVTSAVSCLTVIQPNTPPRFTCGPNQTILENSGPQSVPNWATNIIPHSLPPLDTVIKFNTLPPNGQLFGFAAISGGVLHLTDTINSAFGALALNLPATNVFQTFSASWKSLVGGGFGGGADGYSFNVGDNLPYPPDYGNPAEEGSSTGLSLTLDTWDNGGGDIVGIEIRWQGTRVASAAIPKDNPGDGVYLRKNTFVDASVTVDASGLATLNYDGTVISAQLPGYTGISANRIMFASRTGGANDNHWIDDLTGSSWINNFLALSDNLALAEQSQTVGFLVSNDNPSLFSVQPAISPGGTLTYTPAPNTCGAANVTVVAKDNGGATLCGGNDTSAPCNFAINVSCVNGSNQPPTARIIAGPLADFSPFLPNPVLIAANNFDACLVLDGSTSSDPDSPTNTLSYAWFVQPSPTPFATGVLVTNCYRKGSYTNILVVTDPQGNSGTASLAIDVLNPCEAEGALILIIQNSGLPRNVQQPLVSSVKAACAGYEKFGARAGVNQLETFQKKVQNQVEPIDPALAEQLDNAAQVIIDAINALGLR